jgi:4-diphosphocytidyl-2-C-methyl-D-erythritol kinase
VTEAVEGDLDPVEVDRPRLAASGSVRVRVPAKINLHLAVGPRRDDGYHELATVYQAVSVFDELTAECADGLTLAVEGEGAGTLPTGDGNLAVHAVRLLADRLGVPPNVRLHLTKRIPLSGGLAGGSADAAAALVACDALWSGGLSREELEDLAAELGSDVPFLVSGGTALGTGRGERISPVLSTSTWHWVVAVADGGLSTPRVYGELDALRDAGKVPPPTGVGLEGPAEAPERLLAALRQDDPRVLAAELRNDLQAAALSLRPALRRTLRAGEEEGALATLVSGSGPSCLFLAADADHAARLAALVAGHHACRTLRTAHGPVPGARLVP